MTSTKILTLGSSKLAVDAYRSAGGVVDYVLIDAHDEDDPHRFTAVSAIAELERQHTELVSERMAETGWPRFQFPAMESQPEKARGERPHQRTRKCAHRRRLRFERRSRVGVGCTIGTAPLSARADHQAGRQRPVRPTTETSSLVS